LELLDKRWYALLLKMLILLLRLCFLVLIKVKLSQDGFPAEKDWRFLNVC
jgi:hypothetical protein